MPLSVLCRRLGAPAALALASLMALGACNSGDKQGGNAVALKNLEVVDGTTSDAMTDLDGVRSEGTAVTPSAGNASGAAAAPAANSSDAAKPQDEDSPEVVADQ